MTATEVAQLFRIYVDEQDLSFLPNATVQTMLKISYGEFRRLIFQYDSTAYSNTVTLNLSNVATYDLGGNVSAVRVLGKTPTTTPMERLVRIDNMNADGTINCTLRAASTMQELIQYGYAGAFSAGIGVMFYLQGTVLNFPNPQNGIFNLTYVPVSTVDWTKIGPSDTEFIDDYQDFHDLISLLACTHYAVLNNGLDIKDMLATRKQELMDFFAYGRNPGAMDHVTREW